MKNKLDDKDLALIMAYVDGELDPSQKTGVEKLIASNPSAKAAFEDLKLSSTVYKGYVSDIQDDTKNIRYESPSKKEKTNYFQVIFQRPIRNFIAYPIAAVFIFTLGFQMNSISLRGLDPDTEQFRGMEQQEEVIEKIEALEEEIAELKEQIEDYQKLIEDLNTRLQEKN